MVLQGLKRQCTGSNNGSFKSTKWAIRKSTSIRAYICCVPDNEIHLLASVLESFDECKEHHIVVYVIKGCNDYQRPTFLYRKLVNFLVILKSNDLKEEPTFVNLVTAFLLAFIRLELA